MKNQILKTIAEGSNDLRERLKKIGAVDGKDYTIWHGVETEGGIRYLDRNIKLLADSNDRIRDAIFDVFARFQCERNDGFVEDTEFPNQYSSSERISEEEYRILAKVGNLDAAIRKFLNNKDKVNIKDTYRNTSKKNDCAAPESKSTKSDANFEVYDSKQVEQIKLVLTTEPTQPEIIKKTFGGCVRETFSDREAQKESVCCAGLSAVATLGFLTVKACCETPRLEGESRLHKTRRVVRTVAKQPKTWLITLGTTVLTYGLSIGYQARKRMI